MDDMLVLLWGFLAIVVIKFVLGLNGLLQCRRHWANYEKYVKDQNPSFVTYQHKVVRLFKNAGIKDPCLPRIENVGYGFVQTSNPSVFANLHIVQADVVDFVRLFFQQASGVYTSRMFDAINPLYWIEFIIYLPREILEYVGIDSSSAFVRFAQFLYWVLGVVAGIITISQV